MYVYYSVEPLKYATVTYPKSHCNFCLFLDFWEKTLNVSAHERLGELLNVLKTVVNKYAEIQWKDILEKAGHLIKCVRGKSIFLQKHNIL